MSVLTPELSELIKQEKDKDFVLARTGRDGEIRKVRDTIYIVNIVELERVDFDTLTDGMSVEEKLEKLFEVLERATATVFRKKKEFIETEEEEKDDNEKEKA